MSEHNHLLTHLPPLKWSNWEIWDNLSLIKTKNINKIKALVFDAKNCTQDLILGADFLSKAGMDLKYSTKTIEWLIINLGCWLVFSFGLMPLWVHCLFIWLNAMGSLPFHARPYPIPVIHLGAFKKELLHLVDMEYHLHKVQGNGHHPYLLLWKWW